MTCATARRLFDIAAGLKLTLDFERAFCPVPSDAAGTKEIPLDPTTLAVMRLWEQICSAEKEQDLLGGLVYGALDMETVTARPGKSRRRKKNAAASVYQ